MATRTAPTLADIRAARERLDGVARTTPVYSSETLGRLAGRTLLLKAENLQRTGSFKIRGAVNRLAALSAPERDAGVVAASAGNHGQAVAWAARELGIGATVFMPADAAMAKVDATRGYGADVVLAGESFDEAMAAAKERAGQGAILVHAFDDERVVAGQGTLGLELDDQLPRDVEAVVVPLGGGGLTAGVALSLAELRPDARVVGVQAAACAPYLGSHDFGYTIADGIAVKTPGELTAAVLRDHGVELVAVTDDEIAHAILLLLERSKLVVEGAGAAGVAAVLAGKVAGDGPVCAILSGGNIDPTLLAEVVRHGLTQAARFLVLRTRIGDRPGALARLLALIAAERVNVLEVEHHREGMSLSLAQTEVELTLGTRDEAHCRELLARLEEWGYETERLQ
jgi:threonine dehydratase